MRKTAIFWDNDGVLVDTEVLYYEANRQVLAGLGVELTVEQFAMEEKRSERNRVYSDLLRTRSFAVPGAAEVLEALAGRLATGIVTSSRRDHFELIHARTGFGRFFEFVVSCDDVRNTKPDPEPYLRALELSGRRPVECLAVEDSERGLAAAKAAGLECWVIPTALTRDGDFRTADRVLGSIAEVPGMLFA
ncbi:MAG: HAD-IA family hydrolase [Desulfobacterales bacterium]|nr:HAD-IA family hydrolase [Desulfobacterales bacterium]